MRCPHCQNDLKNDLKNPDKVLCYTCKKRMSKEQVIFPTFTSSYSPLCCLVA